MKETTGEQQARSRIEYWRGQVEEQERSGLSVKQFCETRQITEQSFYVWRKRLREQAPVRFALVETEFAKSTAAEGGLELVLARGERLRINSGADAALLRTVLEVLRG
jgi:transposase-like protein